jgi:cytochrome c oxidase subunit 2
MSRLKLRQCTPAMFVAAAVLALSACGQVYPNSTFTHLTDLNTSIDALWNRLLLFGTIVFIVTETLLILTIFKFRKRPGGPAPKQIHGNAALEITWTVIPALILVLIAVPTVRTIFKTQAKAPAGSLQVEVIGHQWWWEFRYPELGIVTANEVYIPAGRTVNFKLNTRDVLHSFWTPQLGGKRDLIASDIYTKKANYLWYTPDSSLTENVFNGFCTEYCGSSHANMRFRVYTVSADKFASWAAHQKANAQMSPAAPAPAVAATTPSGAKVVTVTQTKTAPTPAPATNDSGYVFPASKLPKWVVPTTPLPTTIAFDDGILNAGNAVAGRELMMNLAKAPCITCHNIRGEMQLMKDDQMKGPNLTHFASRHIFASGLYSTRARELALWIKNAPVMKPGSIMPTLGAGEYSPQMKQKVTAGGLDDRQIADIVAYLLALK